MEQTIGEDRTRLVDSARWLSRAGYFFAIRPPDFGSPTIASIPSKLEVIERGAALEPGDAEAWDILGRHRQLDFANADPVQAVTNYQRAIHDDPLSANYWMNLAGAYEANGDLNARAAGI